MAYALARAANYEPNLSAYGAIVVATTFFFGCPVWPLIGSSAALVKSKEDLKVFRRFLFSLCAGIALIHAALVVTPLSKLTIIPLFGTTQALYDLAYPSLILVLFFPVLIGYRRINHGVLLHVGKPKFVGVSSGARIISLTFLLFVTAFIDTSLAPLTVAALCQLVSLIIETVMSELMALKHGVPSLTDDKSNLTLNSCWKYCYPVMFSSVLSQITLPVGSAVLFRFPSAEQSLVVWPAINGLLLFVRMPGNSFIEFTASVGGDSSYQKRLPRFAFSVGAVMAGVVAILSFTPLGTIYFSVLGGLSIEKSVFARHCLAFAGLYVFTESLLCFYYGLTYAKKQTKLLLAATLISIVCFLGLFTLGLYQSTFAGAAYLCLMFAVTTIIELVFFKFSFRKFRQVY